MEGTESEEFAAIHQQRPNLKMPPNLVQELLGHDDIETTLGLYTHADPEMQREMMHALDELLGTDL